MQSSKDQFKKSINQEFGSALGGPQTSELMKDMNKYSKEMKETEKIKGGIGDKKTLNDISDKHKTPLIKIAKNFIKGFNVELEHTKNQKEASEITMDHLFEDPNYYDKLTKIETKEQLIVRPIKKSEMNKLIGKNTLGKPVGKLFHMNKSSVNEDKVSKSTSRAKKNINDMAEVIKNIGDMKLRKEAASWMLKDFKKQFRDFDSEEFLKMCNLDSNMKENNEETEKKTAKQQFAQDLQTDKDYLDFKKNAKYTKGSAEFTFGAPNVTKEDPYIKKKTKYGRPGRGKETSEATSSGSSGAFSGPIAFKDSDFLRKSFSETPGKLKEGLAVGATGLGGVEKVEATEATTSGSVGGYETPAMWAKSTKKKDWGPSRKTQYKGGSFVKVKKKCTRFPYCNQGDINALKLSKNESVKEAIKNISKKYNISEEVIKTILEYEYSKLKP